jgi:hypothetical protein
LMPPSGSPSGLRGLSSTTRGMKDARRYVSIAGICFDRRNWSITPRRAIAENGRVS